MDKRFLIYAFLLGLMVALWVLLNHNKAPLRESIERNAVNDPRIVLKYFHSKKFVTNQLVGQISAEQGSFFSPNIVELKENITGWRLRDGVKQVINADEATLYFNSNNVTEILTTPSFSSGILRGGVKIKNHNDVLRTESATFMASENRVFSEDPVLVVSDKSWFRGDKGFSLELDTERLTIFGLVKGSVKPETKK